MLELKNITKTYVTGDFKQHALRNVSITLRDNEFVSILGHSGSGKTTLLNIIGGLDQYTSGDLVINGVSTKKYRDRDWDAYRNHSVGFVFQNYNLIPHQTVLANVELALTLSGVSRSDRRARAQKALEAVGLGDQIHKRPSQMSGGQMQRVAIARALINDPEILLADEPTGALDTETSVQIMELLKGIAHDRLVVMVTHNPELAEQYSTRIIRLHDGMVMGDTNPCNEPTVQRQIGHTRKRRRSMSIGTALSLSLNNLMTKKARTLLTSFAGSIGIIGIALILSMSSGFQAYIDRVQEDTLSTYPLTITSETVDMTAMIAAFSTTTEQEEEQQIGVVTEQQMMSRMLSQIGSNDLVAFRDHLEKHRAELEQDINSLQYSYGISPQIYSSDLSRGALRVNPNDLFSGMMGMMGGNAFMNTNVFSQMIEDQDLLDSQYDVIEGRWPERYDELVLVLSNEHAMTDYMAYSLGLRDRTELEEMFEQVMEGEEVTTPELAYDWTYDELMSLTFRLVSVSDQYRYNDEFSVWEDMSDDDVYMRNLVESGEVLRVVGIVTPKAGVAASALLPGFAYLPALTEHVMQNAANEGIVRQQLQNPDVDVFTGKTFEELNSKEEQSGLNFEDMISVDTDMLSEAFGFRISEEYIKTLTEGSMSVISKSITTDTKPALTDFMNSLTGFATEMLTDYVRENADPLTGMATMRASDAETIANRYLDEKAAASLTALANQYVVPQEVFRSAFSPLLSGMITGYVTMASPTDPTAAVPIVESAIPSLVTGYGSNPLVMGAADKMATAMTEAVMQKTILTEVGNLTASIVSSLANAFHVEEDKISAAFTFRLSEEELARLMQAFSSNDKERTGDDNLRTLGYSDPAEPMAISVYLRDFAAKERFVAFIEEYNDHMESMGNDDMVISYTDMTGVLMSSVQTIVNSISYVLIAFVSISLVVSSIMIGVITYISVLERTKEIGILRSIGASKRDISRVFNAETMIVGFGAGVIGIGSTLLLLVPINSILFRLTGIENLRAVLPMAGGIVLVVISVVLTFVAGLIPSGFAARKNPVDALRSE